MAWKLSVSAPKGEFSDAIDRAEPTHHGELHPAAAAQVEAVKALAKAVLPTYDLDGGMVGLHVTGDGGVPSGLVAFSMSVGTAPLPPAPAEPEPGPAATPKTSTRRAATK